MLVVLLLTFFVHSSVSSTLFRTFACETLEDGKNVPARGLPHRVRLLKADGLPGDADIMMLVYKVGILAPYSFLLNKDREFLYKRGTCQEPTPSRATSTCDLWKPYKPCVFYYGVIECERRVLLADVVVFVYPNSGAQIAITLVIAFTFVLISEGLATYGSRWDTWISGTVHAAVVVSVYAALLLKVDVSDERSSNQRLFEVDLVAVHVAMVVTVVLETFVLACALRAEQRESPWPKLHSRSGRMSRSMGKEERERGTLGTGKILWLTSCTGRKRTGPLRLVDELNGGAGGRNPLGCLLL